MRMRRMALGVLAVSLFAGCGRPGRVIHVYTWADYFKPELVRRFETARGCRVVIDTFDSNEAMYAKLKAGASGYDILTPSSYMVALMNSQGMLRPIDHALVPNLVHVDPEYLKVAVDGAMDHSVPYMMSNTGIAYLKSKVSGFVPSWEMFGRADLKGRMTLLNDMRETIGAGLKFLGYSLNTRNVTELEAAKKIILGWRANIAKFENEQYKTGLASGEFLVVQAYSGDILQVRRENPDVAFASPREGAAISVDDLVIPAGAKESGLAHAFIDFLHDPAVAAENTAFLGYLCPNRESYALLSPELRSDPAIFMSRELRAKSEVITDLGEANALYVRIWDEIKSGR
jgi:spermidine/putrescine transport system substrate-binding protein